MSRNGFASRQRLVRAAACAAALAAVAVMSAASRAETLSVLDTDPMRAIAIAEDDRHGSETALGRFLRHPEATVRARAALAAGRLQDSTLVSPLLPLLADSSLEVRREAAFALGQIGHVSALPGLAQLVAATDSELRMLAIEALGKLGDKAATALAVRALDDPLPAVRAAGAVALWRLADSTAVPALVARDNDPDPQVRWRVLWAMEKINAPAVIVLRAALRLEDPDPLVRAHAARTIGREKSARGTAYLLGALDSPDDAVVVNALRALQLIADTTCVACAPRLLRHLSHANPYVRVTAATALGERFAWVRADAALKQRLADSLRAHLEDSDPATRGAAAKSLLARRGLAALPAVLPRLEDTTVYGRVAALEAFRALPPGGEPFALLRARLASGAASLFERCTAAEVMGDRHDPGAGALLQKGLSDSSVLFVSSCASALGALGDTAAVPRLIATYAMRQVDAEPDARLSIIDALRTLGRASRADSLESASPARHPSPAAHDDEFFSVPPERGAVIHTSKGDIEWAFNRLEAPQTVRNFVRLARGGYFDGDFVHRVVPDFVIQDGDPTGTGSGGPGYMIRCEYNRLRYEAGMVGMALSGKDTGGSQWFITQSPQPHLDGRYTIFAHVVRGMDVVQRVVQGDAIVRVEILP